MDTNSFLWKSRYFRQPTGFLLITLIILTSTRILYATSTLKPTSTEKPTKPAGRWTIDRCFSENRNYDVTFFVDVAVRRLHLRFNQRLLIEVTRRLNIVKSQPRIGLFPYGTDIKTFRYKKKWQLYRQLRDAINAIQPVVPLRRNVGKALFFASQTIDTKSSVRSFIVIFVGGRSTVNTVFQARMLRNKGAHTIIIGYDKANSTFLELIAKEAGTKHVVFLPNAIDLTMTGDTILSMICEDLLNDFQPASKPLPRKKQSIPGKNPRLSGPDNISSTSEEINLLWKSESNSLISKYRVTWIPKDGGHNLSTHDNSTFVKIAGLRPATIYRIRMIPDAKGFFGRPLTVITATAPEPVTNFSAEVKLVEPCALQKALLKTYRGSKIGVTLKPTQCKNNRAVVFVDWNQSRNSRSYMLDTVPKAARLVRVTRRSTEQFLANVLPGQEYTLSVIAKGPRLRSSEVTNTSIVIPPVDPILLDTALVNQTTVAIRWQMPRDQIYDGFFIVVVSAYAKNFIRVDATRPSDSTIRPFYTYVLANLRPGATYEVTVFAVSKDVRSPGNMVKKFSTKTPSDLYNEPFLMISGGDGIYAAAANTDKLRSNRVNMYYRAPGGAVNSLYHSRWIRPRNDDFFQSSSFQWQKLLVWIERNTREIKVTDLTSQSQTVTLVSGLLQPVGLAIDPYGETIYWSDIGSRSIGVVSLSNRHGMHPYQINRKLITGDMESPVSLTVGVVDRYLFWGDLRGQIERSNLDGSGRIILLKDESLRPKSLTFYEKTRMLYWVDGATGTLTQMSASGEDRSVVYRQSPDNIQAVVIAGGNFVWFDEEIGSLNTLPVEEAGESQPKILYEDINVPSITAASSYDPDSLETALMRESSSLSFPCHISETFCNGVCIPVTMKNAVCVNECKPWEMLCHKSGIIKCIDKHLVCDGEPNCPKGEDEDPTHCRKFSSLSSCEESSLTKIKCIDTGRCIPYELKCDGRPDCKDGSDETSCLPQRQFCDFEDNDLCLWSQEKSDDDFDWVLNSRRTPSNHTGPVTDHTMKTLNGNYIYLEATPQNEGDKAQLSSVLFTNPVCISFYYYMFGETVGTINLLLKENNGGLEKILWTKSGEQGAVWNKVRVSVDQHSLYKLVIEGVRGADYRSDVAIDDIHIADGLCSVSSKCDFHSLDDAMCGYVLGESWEKVSGDIAVPGSETEVALGQKPSSQDLSSVLGPDWFYFDFEFNDFQGCTECDGAKLVRDISQTKYGRSGIKYVGVTLCSRSVYKIYLSNTLSGPFRNIADGAGKGEDHCEFVGSSNYAKDVGNYKECEGNAGYVRRRWGESLEIEAFGFHRSVYFAPASYSCHFEFPRFVVDNDPKKWQKTLPNSYVFLDFSNFVNKEEKRQDTMRIPVSLSSRSEIISTNSHQMSKYSIFVLSPTNPSKIGHEKVTSSYLYPRSWCLKFRYFMIGSDAESLTISVNDEYKIWVKNQNQGEQWNKAQVDIPYPATKYDIIITATRGFGYEGSIGVDDVEIIQDTCSHDQNYKCSFDAVIDEDCSFSVLHGPAEQITLNTLYKREKFTPEIVQSRNYPSGVITGREVALANGTILTSSPILRSPLLPKLSQFYPVMCLTVNYRQRSDRGELSVEILNKNGRYSLTHSKHVLPSQKFIIRPWLTYVAQIDETLPTVGEEPFYVEFRGLNATWVNELSLDTVECSKIMEEQCHNKVKCKSGVCVAPELLCDGINDCGDWSDEIGCSSGCGSVADYFDVQRNFVPSAPTRGYVCTYRVHGQPGKDVFLTVGVMKDVPASENIILRVYKGFMKRHPDSGFGHFSNSSLVIKTDVFSEKLNYLIKDHEITITVEYTSSSLKPVRIAYEMVEHDHCSLVCPNHQCLFSNHYCDGKIGCSDGSDERNCARVVEKFGVRVLEVRHLDGPFAPVCADDITESVADAICTQLNDLHAQRPLNTTRLPASYNSVKLHRLNPELKITETTLIQSLIQASSNDPMTHNASFPHQPKKRGGQCKSRQTWIPNCISYKCGVRPIEANPFLSQYGGLSPIMKIIGGKTAKKGKWPWIASLLLRESAHNCGGTLISDRFIVTAAHCFDDHDAKKFTVLLGATSSRNYGSQTSKHSIKAFRVHESYNKRADIPDYDIALLEISPPAHFSTYISPICLPHGNMAFPPGTECHIAGFGHIAEGKPSENTLHEAKTPIISNAACDTDLYRGSITDRMVCAGYPDTGGVGICHGDSGGPLMCKNDSSWYLVGVTSWSIGCANKGKPDVFSRLMSYIGWINTNAGFNLTLPSRSRPISGTCGGTYYGSQSGNFASPGWPGEYYEDQLCTYVILANLGQRIHLRFEEFETEKYFDFVDIFAGNTLRKNRIVEQHSGRGKPKSLNAVTSALYVVFTSDDDTNEKGFVAHWEISGKKTDFEGPAYPIEIQLKNSFGQVTLQAYSNSGLFIYAGIGTGGWPYYKQFPVRNEDHKLAYIPQIGYWTVRTLDSHRPNANTGMRVQCAEATPDKCDSTWELWTGSRWAKVNLKLDLKTPIYFPLHAKSNQSTSSSVTTTPKPAVASTTTVSTSTTKATTISSTSSLTFSSLPVVSVSAGASVTTSTTTENPGDSDCGGISYATSGVIQTPGYTDKKDYSNNLNCTWYINTPNPSGLNGGRWILIYIFVLDTQQDRDFLKGYVGHGSDLKLLFSLSGQNVDLGGPAVANMTKTLLTYRDINSNGMTLTFTTDGSVTGKGFFIRYYFVDELSQAPQDLNDFSMVEISEGASRSRRSNPSSSIPLPDVLSQTAITAPTSSSILQTEQTSIEMVDPKHCSLVCPNGQCLLSNYYCDGKIGCPDGSDESNCVRIVEKSGVEVLEVKHFGGPFAPICAEDMTEEVADVICKQLNGMPAQRPLVKTILPAAYDSVKFHRLNTDFKMTESTLIQSLIQTSSSHSLIVNASFPHLVKKIGGQCESRQTWIPRCISHKCGVKPIQNGDQLSIPRIIGGSRSTKGRWPWIASLLANGIKHLCGGNLISDKYVLTAAHCFDHYEPKKFTVFLGASSTGNFSQQVSKHSIKDYHIHRSYKKLSFIPDFDIAIIEIDPPARFSSYISPICLHEGDMEFPRTTKCFIAGFGETTEGPQVYLNEAETQIISYEECDRDRYWGSITPRMVCAGYPKTGGIGICHTDSGGPLMCENDGSWYLVGVASWSIGCALKGNPDVFSRVSSYIGWINDNTEFNLTLPSKNPSVTGTCGGTYYGSQSGTFASPGWPGKYYNGQLCTYAILADLGQTIHLRFEEFQTEDYFDFVDISVGNTLKENRIVKRHSGNGEPRPVIAVTSALYTVFDSDTDLVAKGFIARWRISGEKTNFEGPTPPIEIRLESYSSDTTLETFSNAGLFIYAGIGPGGWPYYSQHSAKEESHKLAYIPQIGYWTIRTPGNHRVDANTGMRVQCAEATPDKCDATWELWTGFKWTKIDLKLDVNATSRNKRSISFSFFPDTEYFYMENGSELDWEEGSAQYFGDSEFHITSLDDIKPDPHCNFNIILNSTEYTINYVVEQEGSEIYRIQSCLWRIRSNNPGEIITLDIVLNPYNERIITYLFLVGNKDDHSMFRVDIAPEDLQTKTITATEEILIYFHTDGVRVSFSATARLGNGSIALSGTEDVLPQNAVAASTSSPAAVHVQSDQSSIKTMDPKHCSLVCPNGQCLYSNYHCDGKIGCPDGSDESNCAQIVENSGVKVLEVKHFDGPFAPICADDVTEEVADVICKQLNGMHAQRPLRKTRLPSAYDSVKLHRLITDFKVTESTLIQSLIQRLPSGPMKINASFPHPVKKIGGLCESRQTWVPSCISHKCGVRPIDDKPFPSQYGGLSSIPKIIGGSQPKKGRWPWIASFLLSGITHHCGGSLISEKYILTAAHCFDEFAPKKFTVLLGASSFRNFGQQASKHSVKDYHIHRSYNKRAVIPDFDIAIIEIDPPAHFSSYISPICLPQGDMEFPPTTKCFIAGFGHTTDGSQNFLNEAETPIISNDDCDKDWYHGSITDRMVCAGHSKTGGIGICHGDSGGPLMCENDGSWCLVGVTSWSIGCANKGRPDVFSRIMSYIGWINENAGFNLTLPSKNHPVFGTCGGTYYGSQSGTFASPGWPWRYYNGQLCTYAILADLGQTIHLRFEEFRTEKYFDFMDISVGNTMKRNRLVKRHSGINRPRPVSVVASALYTVFVSDEDTIDKGFIARWRISGKKTNFKGPTPPIEIQLRSYYGLATLQAFTNVGLFFYAGIGPGGWPYYLQQSSKQEPEKLAYIPQIGYWTIRTLGNHRFDANTGMRVQCAEATPDKCDATWELWTGSTWMKINLNLDVKANIQVTPTMRMIRNASSNLIPTLRTTTTTTTTTVATTTTEDSVQNDNCGGVIYSTNGTIYSPEYNNNKNCSNNLNCNWYINPPYSNENKADIEGRWILIHIIALDTQQNHDFFKGYAGNRTDSKPLFELSGRNDNLEGSTNVNRAGLLKYRDVHSNGMTLTFTTDGSITRKGLFIRFYFVDELSQAPLDLNDFVVVEVSEEETRKRRSLIPDLSYFYMEGSGLDWDEGSGQYYEYYDYITTLDNIKPHPSCNFNITLNSTDYTIQYAFGKNESKVYKVQNCLWRIKSEDSAKAIDLNVNLSPYSGGKIIAYLFLVGNDDDDNMFRVDSAPRSLLTRTIIANDEVLIFFHTDGVGVDFNVTAKLVDAPITSTVTLPIQTMVPGLTPSPTSPITTTAVYGNSMLETVQITSSCENVTGEMGDNRFYIQSPNHPEPYNGNQVCMWVLKAPSSQKIAITFTRMAIEFVSMACGYDNVTIYDGENTNEPVSIICGNIIPKPVISTGSVMVVKFSTDKLIQDTGFRAIITTLDSNISDDEMDEEDVIFSCDFDDEHICGFVHDKSVDVEFAWAKQDLVTPSENTGPPHDASESKNGYYLYIEASMPRVPGDRARLISPVFRANPGEQVCLSFAYSMNGLSVGSLAVHAFIASDGIMKLSGEESEDADMDSDNIFKLRPIVTNFGAGLYTERMKTPYRNNSERPDWQQYVLWSKAGEHDEKPWLHANIPFTPNNDFQILFEGIRGSEYQSDIAIDNVVLKSGGCRNTECGETQFKCASESADDEFPICISKEFLCDGHNDCEDGSDETECSSPLAELCQRTGMENILLNTTEWMICNNVEKCHPPNVNIAGIKEIACDGVFDCFGGFDESFCDIMNKQTDEISLDDSQMECGVQTVENEEYIDRNRIHNVPPDTVPWISGLYIRAPDFHSQEESQFIFLCSATFIRDDWLVMPAHCILDPEMTEDDLQNFLFKKSTSPSVEEDESEETDYEEKPNKHRYDSPLLETSIPNELKDLYERNFGTEKPSKPKETLFEYFIISPARNSDSEKEIFEVSKLVPHPKYTVSEPSQECNSSAKSDSKFTISERTSVKKKLKSIDCDVTRINNDVALIKIVRKEDEKTEDDIADKSRSSDQRQSKACLNELRSSVTAPAMKSDTRSSTYSNNMLRPPSESIAFSKSFKSKATCYAYGFSFSTDSNIRFMTELKLSRKSLQISYGDRSTSRILCGMQSHEGPTDECLEKYRDNAELKPLLVGGYNEIRNSPFMYDQGSVLMCQGWDYRWYLTGLYSWANFYRNLQRDRLYEIPLEDDVTGGILKHGSVVGMPLGVDVFMDISLTSGWIQNTLDEDCPGEFPCYDAASGVKQKCIPKHKQCDGIIDCPLNYADEVNCSSGCIYNPEKDPFLQYYKLLDKHGVNLPKNIVTRFNLTVAVGSSLMGDLNFMEEKNPKSIIVNSQDNSDDTILTYEEDNEKSWRSDLISGRIRANSVKDAKRKMCVWTVKAPEDKVATIQVNEYSAIPGGNRIQIISSEAKKSNILLPGKKDVYYTSKPGGTITIRILPPNDQPYLKDIKYFEAFHQIEAIGNCDGRHKCGDDSCVSPHQVCDGVWDCADRSDELSCISGCGGPAFISGPSSGEILSKNFPFGDSGNGDCEWQFVVKSNGETDTPHITFEFIEFRTDPMDSMFLFSGAGAEKSAERILGVFSGEKEPFTVTVTASNATLLLKSNDFVNRRKFKMRYTIGYP